MWKFFVLISCALLLSWITLSVRATDAVQANNDGGSSTAPASYVWSNEVHPAPIMDLKDIIKRSNTLRNKITVLDYNFNAHCVRLGTCAPELKVIKANNALELAPCPVQIMRDFYLAYRDDPTMLNVDMFFASTPSAMNELFMPFNRSMIVYMSLRYEANRWQKWRWQRWNENLIRIAADPKNILVANNHYDAKYVQYFTGLTVPVVPSLCKYTNATYEQVKSEDRRPEILIGMARFRVDNALVDELVKTEAARAVHGAKQYVFAKLRDLYPKFEYSDIVHHPAILLLPYQVSVMSFFEYYRMNIPMFCPSHKFLVELHLKYALVVERLQRETPGGMPRKRSVVRAYRGPLRNASNEDVFRFDPNDDTNVDGIRYWLQFADYYHFPHVVLFDSWEDLLHKLDTTDLDAISARMKEHNEKEEPAILQWWTDNITRSRSMLTSEHSKFPDYDTAMKEIYGLDTSKYIC